MGAKSDRCFRAGAARKGRAEAVARGGSSDAAAPRQSRSDRLAADARRSGFVSSRTNPRDAYEKRVDALLSSPHYGERMAMQWLDLARYADTHGYHIDSHRDSGTGAIG